ncbi:hypothetical protein COLO4_23509 [Corchorus olitorius]|uniref:Uncharacterized protein n=1 Tax=Corchorus olitorius TaxID=93759 RepID=A0A1R3IG63_9ROSI|nr:hypothetical protein COLO4_23509 [Corchorus olitorius]
MSQSRELGNLSVLKTRKNGKKYWKSLKAPSDFTKDEEIYHRASFVFEGGKKILILLVDLSCGEQTLYIYDAQKDFWEPERKVDSPDYSFPLINELDVLHLGNNNSFVLSASTWSAEAPIQKPLGLMRVARLTEADWHGDGKNGNR